MKTRICEVCNQVFMSKAHNAVNCSEKCKRKKYQDKNKEYFKQKGIEFRDKNPEYSSIKKKEWYAKNKEAEKINIKKWQFKNKDKVKKINNNSSAKYRAAKLNATLPGYEKEIKDIYDSCPKGFHVDHIVPLQGKNVKGLHVPWNLRVVTSTENLKKGNKLIQEVING